MRNMHHLSAQMGMRPAATEVEVGEGGPAVGLPIVGVRLRLLVSGLELALAPRRRAGEGERCPCAAVMQACLNCPNRISAEP